MAVYKPALEIRAIRDELESSKGKGSRDAFKTCADALRRLEERASSATRFSRQGSEDAEAAITLSIELLTSKVSALKGLGAEGIDDALGGCAMDAISIVKAIDRRERGLVR